MGFGEDHCKDVWAPFGLSIFTSVVTSLLTIITLPGNLFICIAILKDPNKELKTSFNYLLFNMAISDLIVGVITQPIFVLFHVREALGYSVITWYALPHMSFFITCTASLLSIAALAIERTITVNAQHRQRITAKRAIKCSMLIWVISLTLPCSYFKLGYFKFAFIFAIFTVLVTLAIIIVAFLKIYGNVSKASRNLKINASGKTAQQSSRVVQKRTEFEQKVTRGFLGILAFYALCNLPACIFIFIVNLCDECSCLLIHWSRDLLLLLVLMNCSGNQFLYAWRMKTFTRAFSRLTNHSVSEGSLAAAMRLPDGTSRVRPQNAQGTNPHSAHVTPTADQ
ncbi:predicted protein [Nematostella vectensis]|uniref:G-protein coupled receptors family 1 profile domain-containing protein n=1 Tax=Nematostella vectensis TaxID=45351 RepID=A7SD07_NEMVE|nr:D(2) dopamine receptor-like [Nematostella vectensis]EDO38430.1 predicted protein [Nematostella vectensis]|eukprot:XP_001630493.1 predicted protein [Nematostella vectensis]